MFVSLLFGCSVTSNSLWSHELQHARLLCPSLTTWVLSNSCPWIQWCHPTILFFVKPSSSCPQSFPTSRSFSMSYHHRWSKYWNFHFSINSSNGYSQLISFRIDWFDLLAIQWALKYLLKYHSSKASILALSLIYGPTHPSIHDYWKNHRFDYLDLYWQNYASGF